MNQIPKIQKIDAILADKGIVKEMLEFSNALNRCGTEINNLFMENRTLYDTDIQNLKVIMADILLHIDKTRRHFEIKREEMQKFYDKLLEMEFSNINKEKGEEN